MKRVAIQTVKGMRQTLRGRLGQQSRNMRRASGQSSRTIDRWIKDYDRMGLSGLMRPVRATRGSPGRLCAEARRFIYEQYLAPVRRTQNAVLRNVKQRARERARPRARNALTGKDRSTGMRLPHRNWRTIRHATGRDTASSRQRARTL
jgi:hypothetical protein